MVGTNPLIQLIVDNEWQKALDMIQANGLLARKWSTAQSFTGVDQRQTSILPIHQACAKQNVSIHFLESLNFAYPEGMLRQESGALRCPLHIAIRTRVSDEVLFYMLDKFPEVISVADSMGRIALHYACSNHASMELVNRLITMCPESVRAADNMGWTPLHVAASIGHRDEVVETMLGCSPEACVMVTRKGNTPLDVANRSETKAKDAIVEMLKKEETKFHKTPTFENMMAAYQRHLKFAMPKTTAPTSRVWGVRKRVRSNSVRRVV
jgi:hypothetical protein